MGHAGGLLCPLKLTQLPLCSRQSQVWEQKVGGSSAEEPLAPEVSISLPPLPPELGGSGVAKVTGLEESQATPKEESGLRPRINLRGIMRSISLLEPTSEPESTLEEASNLPEVRLGFGVPQVGAGPQGGGCMGTISTQSTVALLRVPWRSGPVGACSLLPPYCHLDTSQHQATPACPVSTLRPGIMSWTSPFHLTEWPRRPVRAGEVTEPSI